MKKRLSKITRTQRLLEGKTTAGPTRFTRLSKDSDEVVTALAGGNYTVANVIRDLVDEALNMRHLNQAGRHPAVRQLLLTFDELVNDRVQQATRPLEQHVFQIDRCLAHIEDRQNQTNRFLATLFITFMEKFDFRPEKPDDQYEQRIYDSCADKADEMIKLILSPQLPAASPSTPALRDVVASELSNENNT